MLSVLDIYFLHAVAWSMKLSMTAQLPTDALMMAIWRRGRPNKLLHHLDQYSHYTSEQF